MASPSTLYYSILTGILKFTPSGGVEQDLGNAPAFTLQPNVEKEEHRSSRAGTRVVDFSLVSGQQLTARFTLEEINAYNLRLALMGGDIELNSDGNQQFGIFANTQILGALSLTGQNTQGSKVNLTLPSVSIVPSGEIGFISEGIAQMEFEAEVQYVEELGDFGNCEVIEPEIPSA